MAHTHQSVAFTSDGKAHVCVGPDGDSTICGYTGSKSHVHPLSGDVESPAHTHQITSYTIGSSELGSPNWWEHRHTISGTTNAGLSHTHPKSVNCIAMGCLNLVGGRYPCDDNPHTHPQGGSANTGAEAAHTHSFSGNTGYADQSGTPENHVHPFALSTPSGGAHSHTIAVAWSQGANVCYYGTSHTHSGKTSTNSEWHYHLLSSNTGFGGEPLPVIPYRGDGLVWISA